MEKYKHIILDRKAEVLYLRTVVHMTKTPGRKKWVYQVSDIFNYHNDDLIDAILKKEVAYQANNSQITIKLIDVKIIYSNIIFCHYDPTAQHSNTEHLLMDSSNNIVHPIDAEM